MPPRHGKSMLVSHYFPAWWLGNRPDDHVILTSYSDRFAASWGRKARDTFREWAHPVFGLQPKIGQHATEDWGILGHGGGMTTAGTAGTLTGRGANLLIVDDPIKDAQAAGSSLVRDNLWEWWLATSSTRLEPDGVVVVVQTHWHMDDLAGRLQKNAKEGGEPWLVVRMPAIAVEDEHWRIDDYVWERPAGAALWPQRWPEAVLRTREQQSAYWWASLYQQRPVPPGGAIFKRAKFQVVDALPAEVTSWARSWDCGGGEATRNHKRNPDYTAGVKIGRHPTTGAFYVADVVRGQWSPLDVDRIIKQTAQVDGWQCPIVEEREPGSAGIAVTTLRHNALAGYDYRAEPATGEKTLRWQPYANQVEAGNVYLLKGDWNRAFLDEHEIAPNGANDDQIDAATGAFMRLALGREAGDLGLTI